MGFFSYNCKECGHPLLSQGATDPGINDWMVEAVVLTGEGSRILGEYDGYGRVGDYEIDYGEDVACLHRACWEVAEKPEYEKYGSPSDSASDQGFFFDCEHDLIDPRITEDRDRLLQEGIAARTKRRFDARARDVFEWLASEDPEFEPWKKRFSFGKVYEDGKIVLNTWYCVDSFGELFKSDETFHGTSEDIEAMLQGFWSDFVASPECKALLARAEEIKAEAQARYHETLKAEGRFEVGYSPSKVGGDIVDGRTMHRELFYVNDKLSYTQVATFDYEGTPRDFGPRDPNYSGNHSPEWEARVEENRVETRERAAKANAEAVRLNKAWAAEGYPT